MKLGLIPLQCIRNSTPSCQVQFMVTTKLKLESTKLFVLRKGRHLNRYLSSGVALYLVSYEKSNSRGNDISIKSKDIFMVYIIVIFDMNFTSNKMLPFLWNDFIHIIIQIPINLYNWKVIWLVKIERVLVSNVSNGNALLIGYQ